MYKLVFENEHFIIVDKDAMVLTVPSRFTNSDKREVLGTRLQRDFKTKIYPVHRLDFEVSGLVLFAKNNPAQVCANRVFMDRKISKRYHALSLNHKEIELKDFEKVTWECKLLKGKKRAYEKEIGKPSTTIASIVSRNDLYMLWDLMPVTGRSHQLRYEMYRHHVPIVGDQLYGSTQKYPQGIALRSYLLDLSLSTELLKMGLPSEIKIDGIFLPTN